MRATLRLLDKAASVLVVLSLVGCGAAAAKGGYESAVSEPYGGGGGGGDMTMSVASTGDYYDDYEADYAYPAAEMEEAYAPAPLADFGGGFWKDEIGYAEKAPPAPADVGYTAALEVPDVKGTPPEPSDPSPDQPADETATDAGGKKPDRIILYVAEMNLAVFRVEEKIDEIRALIKTWDGYMISMDSNRIVFRVPADRFEDALEELEALGDVTYRNVNGTDVTDEYRDLQIRLKNAIAVRDRLLELLSEAKNIQESLQVEHELERITEKIELMKGRLKYIKEAASYSKITVHLSVKKKAKKPIPPLYAPFKWIQDVGLDTLFNF